MPHVDKARCPLVSRALGARGQLKLALASVAQAHRLDMVS
jgi:hypothetical protein